MKSLKHLASFLLITLLFSSCQKKPEAYFTYSPEAIKAGQQVSFKNTTTDADSYLWDFGDGTTSTEENPTHIFNAPGIYDVILTAYTEDEAKKDLSFQQIEVTMTTGMELTVRDIYIYDIVENCQVTVYDSSSDYYNLSNPIAVKYTNSEGKVAFYNLQPKVYYIRAIKFDGSYILSNENLANVTTKLTANKLNSYVVYVEIN